jgi:6-pyruvoyltetrahydropterin/6-carboxytetrahydropterin synthase
MPYRICKTFLVESGHILSKHPGKCRFPHGHSRRIDVILEAGELNENDMVCDFKHVKDLIAEFVEEFDHAMCLNTSDPHYEFYRKSYDRIVAFENVDPTTELMAKMIFDEVEKAILRTKTRTGLTVISVRVHETETTWAEYLRA